MNEQEQPQDLKIIKRMAAIVYLCQVLTFFLAGLPLLVGVVINFIYKKRANGSWLESHFDWQIKTAWLTLAGFALAGLTFPIGIGLFILLPTVILLIYRIIIGWGALNSDRAVKE